MNFRGNSYGPVALWPLFSREINSHGPIALKVKSFPPRLALSMDGSAQPNQNEGTKNGTTDPHNWNEAISTQDHGKGGLSLRGVAVTTETATTAETVKTVTAASWCCFFYETQKEGKVLCRTAKTVKTAKPS